MTVISAPRVLVGGHITGPASVIVDNGLVVDVLPATGRQSTGNGHQGHSANGYPTGDPDHIALPAGILTPGLIDLQVNGGFGVDLQVADESGWAHLAGSLAARGVTAFQPTFITAPVTHLREALERAAALRPLLDRPGYARILGTHLEGPFLSPLRNGVHLPALMTPPTPEALDVLLADGLPEGTLTMVTIAPEQPGALDAVRRLRKAGVVVSVGHSDATADVVRDAADAGATMVTHIFNAQRGLRHREPGVAGQALDDHRYHIGLIPDLQHVSAPVCRLVLAVAAGRVALVSDAMAAAGMPPGRYELGGQLIEVTADGPPRDAAGTIAGSALCLDTGVRNLVEAGCDEAVVLDAATRVPAEVMGREDLGRLAPGALADMVWWGDDLSVRRTWIGGEVVFDATRSVPAPGG